jgi:hypothetical protein
MVHTTRQQRSLPLLSAATLAACQIAGGIVVVNARAGIWRRHR